MLNGVSVVLFAFREESGNYYESIRKSKQWEGGRLLVISLMKVNTIEDINYGLLNRGEFMEDLNLRGKDWKGGY